MASFQYISAFTLITPFYSFMITMLLTIFASPVFRILTIGLRVLKPDGVSSPNAKD